MAASREEQRPRTVTGRNACRPLVDLDARLSPVTNPLRQQPLLAVRGCTAGVQGATFGRAIACHVAPPDRIAGIAAETGAEGRKIRRATLVVAVEINESRHDALAARFELVLERRNR